MSVSRTLHCPVANEEPEMPNPFKAALKRLLPESVLMHLQAADHYFNGEPEIRLVRSLVTKGMVAVDAGANIGTYSYFLRQRARRVYAYEPNPGLAARLAQLMPDVTVRQVALSSKPGSLELSVPLDDLGRPSHELGSVAQKFDGECVNFTVECITIDSEGLNEVGFIKIDVEQHEREVLRGALQTISRCRPVIFVEVYPLKYQRSLAQEFAFILEQGYCAWFSFRDAWHPLSALRPQVHASAENFGKANLFMGNNLFMFPDEHPRAKLGPAKSG